MKCNEVWQSFTAVRMKKKMLTGETKKVYVKNKKKAAEYIAAKVIIIIKKRS